MEGCRGRFVPDRQRFLLPSHPRPGRGYVPGPPTYIHDVLPVWECGDNGGCGGLCGCGVCKLAVCVRSLVCVVWGECVERVCVVDPSRFPTVVCCYPDRCSTVPLTLSL